MLRLDLILASPALENVWAERVRVEWEDGPLRVVSRTGLAAMKRLRGTGQDRDDIQALEAQDGSPTSLSLVQFLVPHAKGSLRRGGGRHERAIA